MKNLYLALTIPGGITPYLFFSRLIQAEGVYLPLFIDSLFINGAARGFSADLLLPSIVFWIFLFQQAKKPGAPRPYVFIGLNLTIGLSCAVPACLYAREVRHKVWTNCQGKQGPGKQGQV